MKTFCNWRVCLALIVFTSCTTARQVSHNSVSGTSWKNYNSFAFCSIECEKVPASINESVIQQIQEGVEFEMGEKGYLIGNDGEKDLLVSLHFSFNKNIPFANTEDMNAYVEAGKYGGKTGKNKSNSFNEGEVEMKILDAETYGLLWSSHAKGFVNKDGSDVVKGNKLKKGVAKALFQNFPKTGKPTISALKRKQQEEEEKKKSSFHYY